MIAANLAFVVFVDVESMPHHRERIDREKGIGEGGADACQALDGLGGLHGAHHACQRTEHAHHRTGFYLRHSWWLWEDATIASRTGLMRHHLSAIPIDATYRECLSKHHASIVDEVLGREVVRAFHHEIIVSNQVEGIVLIEEYLVLDDVDIGIHGFQALLCHVDLE